MQICLPVLTFAKCLICMIKWVSCTIVILFIKRCIFFVQTEKCHDQERNTGLCCQNVFIIFIMFIMFIMVLKLNGMTIKADSKTGYCIQIKKI